MSRRRIWVTLAVVVGVLVTAAGIGWAVWGEDLTYRHTLVKYDNDSGEPNRYVNLDNGDAQLAIGSPNDHRIVVQWRDPDGHGWTEPETVWNDEKNIAIENTVRYGGGTVAILQMYTTDIHSDSDIDSVTVGIVCRELTCTAQKAPGFGGEAQVTPDGRTVYLGQDPKGVHLWTAQDGIHRVRWSGHPGFEYGVVSPGKPLLAPDGSLRVVSAGPSGAGTCTFDLHVGTPGTADLTRAARTTVPLRGLRDSDCGSYLGTYSADWVAVHPDDRAAPDFWFIRDGDRWTTTRDDPSGLELIEVDRGCCDTSISGFVHWDDVAYGSPDGRRIVVQQHQLGEETWSEPVTLEGAPAGYRCTWLEGYEIGDGFAILMTCHSGKIRNDFYGDAYAVAVTPDLRTWESKFFPDATRDPQAEADQLVVGRTTWTPEDGFEER